MAVSGTGSGWTVRMACVGHGLAVRRPRQHVRDREQVPGCLVKMCRQEMQL